MEKVKDQKSKEMQIKIEYKEKTRKERVPIDYKLFLKKIQLLYNFTNKEMSLLQITYKDSDEENTFYIIENQNELTDCLSNIQNSFIALKLLDFIDNSIDDLNQSKKHISIENTRLVESIILNKEEIKLIVEDKKQNEAQEEIKPQRDDNKLMERLEEMITSIRTETKESFQNIQNSMKEIKNENQLIQKKLSEIEKRIDQTTDSIRLSNSGLDNQIKQIMQEQMIELDKVFTQAIKGIKSERIIKKRSTIIHSEINCSNCQMKSIRGIRYQCSECKEISLCEKCYEQNNHNEHMFLIIKDSEKYEEQLQLKQNQIKDEVQLRSSVVKNIFGNLSTKPVTRFLISPEIKNEKIQNELFSSKINNFSLLSNQKLKDQKITNDYINDHNSYSKRRNENISMNSPIFNQINKNDPKIAQSNLKDKQIIETTNNKKEKKNETERLVGNPKQGVTLKIDNIKNEDYTSNIDKSFPISNPKQENNWEEKYQEMDKKFAVSSIALKEIVIKFIAKHNGNIEKAIEDILSHNSLIG